MKHIITNKGSASLEAIIMAAALVGFMYIMAHFSGQTVRAQQAEIKANDRIWRELQGTDTPCLEDKAVGEFAGGKFNVEMKQVIFMPEGGICN